MEKIQCTKCLGDGIIGSGDNPHLKLGKQVTCDMCGGTGKIDAPTASQGIVAPEEEKTENTASDTDNTQSEDGEEKKSDESAAVDSQETVSNQITPEKLGQAGNEEDGTGPYQNMQQFEVGQQVKFFIENVDEKYAGIHTITAIEPVEVGTVLQTDKSEGVWIHAHWFAPLV